MELITWNIQSARGVDGVADHERIVAHARELGDFDVLCLQEVAANFPLLGSGANDDGFARFAQLLPGFTAISAPAVDVLQPDGRRSLFGNLILSRYPVLRVLRHQLPWLAETGNISMPRVLIEATLATPLGELRVMTTHLEYHSAAQRSAQVEAIRAIHAQSCGRAVGSREHRARGSPYDSGGHAVRAVLTGDFNFRPQDPLHARLQQASDGNAPRLLDTWPHLHPGVPHPHNVGLYDREQWPEPFTCNFIYASEDLLPHVREVRVHAQTQASDHQPQLVRLA